MTIYQQRRRKVSETERRYRGKGKKPAKRLISLRLEPDIYDYFENLPSPNMQAKLRNALREYIQIKENENESNIEV